MILTPQNQTPTASAGPDQTILLSQGAQLNGSASDDGLPSGNLTTTWTKVSGPGTVTFMNPNVTITGVQFSAVGTYVLRLIVNDSALSSSDELTITVDDNVAPPTVEITSPGDGSELTEPTPITGSVSNGAWVLEYSLNSEDGAANQVWTQSASGTGPVTNSSLGTLDTTLMLNGIYSLRLRATDNYGQSSFTSIAVLVDKNFKVGQFQIAFSDLNVPVAGLPIEVIRSYDSRDKRVGDFGVGWQLGIRSARVEKTGVLGFGWHQTVTSGFIPTYCLEPSRPHKVAITFGDGKVFKFRASTAIHCQQFAPISATQLTFTPEPGTHATLESTTATDVIVAVQGGIPGPVQLINQSSPDIYNTGTFRLTTAEGTVYVIDQRTGVSSVRDAYGNTVTVGAGGIVHSSGQSIAFTRDGAGRITQITDPAGNPQTYSYDANGDLVSYIDREQNPTTFTYNSNHHLLSITDARGIELLTNQYDPSSGRLIGQTDAFNKSLVYDHDVSGRAETITDRLGNPTRYEYDERGNVLRQVDARGGIKRFTYDEFDNVLTETNALNQTTTYTYDAADNRTSIKDHLDNITQFTYNNARQPLTVTDARDNVTTNIYDAAGTNLLTTRDPLDNPTSFTYSVSNGQRTTMTDALTHITRYGYDTANRLESETDALGNVTSYGYDPNGNRITQTVTRTNALGQIESIVTVYTYDKLNRLTKTTFADGSFPRVEYNAIGQQAASIDQLDRRTEFTYDEMGRLTRTDYPDGTHEDATYDAEGHRLTSRDRAGRFTSFTYDELGRLTKRTYPDDTFTSTTYDAAGQVLTTTDARHNVTRYFYDDAGRRTKVKNALNQETTFTYDANGNQLTMTDALLHTTTYEYDDNNRRIKTIYHDSSFETVGYDELGRSVSKTDQANKTTRFTYDALGRLTKVKDALNQETLYGYSELGQQLTQTDANNHTTRFEYDQLGRRVKRILPAGQFETYAYDNGGNLQNRTDFNGKTTTFNYDVMRRLLSKVPDASLNQPTISFTYNNIGQRATMSDASGTTIYNYDGRNRLAGKQTPFGTLSYTYDDAGNLLTTRSSNANGTSVDYVYDELNRLATAKDNNLGAVSGGITTYNYDTVGNLQSYLYPNGVTTTYNYNSLNRLSSMNASTAVSTLASYAYTLGAAGNRTAVTELGGRTVNYTYDDLYRLTNETIANDTHGINGTVGYGYDPVGNRHNRNSSVAGVPSQNSTYDANDRLTSDTYDANGNTKASTGGTYDYDFENRLASLITHDSSLITFLYDGDGNRVAKTVGGVTTNYLVDTNNHTGYAQVIEELQAGAVVKQFTYGHDLISQRCTLPTANFSLSFYGYDGHGSVRFLTDTAAVVTDTYSYDAFGILIYRSGSTSNDYLYSGEQFDNNLGLYYLRARYMNPSSGRFWSMDSYEGGSYDPGSLHKYLYARNSPTNLIDPSGHFSLVDTLNTSVLIGTISGFAMGLLSGGLEGAVKGAIQGAIMGTLVPLTGAGVGSFLLGNAARGVFITGWGVGLGTSTVSGFSLATATNPEERLDAGIGLLTTAAFMYFGPKLLQRANTRIVSGQQANDDFASMRPGSVERPWPGTDLVSETTVFARAKAVRVYTEGRTDPVGYWVMEASEIEGLTAAQIQEKFALPFKPSHISAVDIPAGTTIRIGAAGSNRFGPGGGMQIEIQRPNFPSSPNPAPSYGPGVPVH